MDESTTGRETMRELFTISQVSRSCGVSRATILRLESRGLLEPAMVDKNSGYRYYDNHNVSWIMQIQLFLKLGLSYDDILLYLRTNGTSAELLRKAEEKLSILQRACNEIRLRVTGGDAVRFEYVDLPECICFTGTFRAVSSMDGYQAMYGLYREAVERGYRLLADEPLFVINEREDFIHGEFDPDADVGMTCCIPLEPSAAPKDAVLFPACRAFSCVYHGSYKRRDEAFNALGRKIRELGLKTAGHVRMIGLVASYTSREISNDNFVTRLAVPVGE